MKTTLKLSVIMLAFPVLLGACGKSPEVPADVPSRVKDKTPGRIIDTDSVARGAVLYKANCAACHGQQGQGAPGWQQRGPDGKMPPPPLNGTGHAWHHPAKVLRYTILNGTKALGGNMPAWKGKLSEQDIEDIIAWFQSKWPDEIYKAWLGMDRSS